MTTVLVVDDEPAILRALTVNLKARKYDVLAAATGEQALHLAAARHPDLVLVDLGLPGISGLEVIEGLRGWTSVPIIVLSARDSEAAKVKALDLGADDYVTKPFGIDELMARLRAVLRRHLPGEDVRVVATSAFRLDLTNKTAALADASPVRLTPLEWAIVEVLVRHAGRLVTQRFLLDQVWADDGVTDAGALRVHLTHIRRKLEPDPARPRYFVTDPGMGYRFLSDDER